MFSVLQSVVLADLPYPNADRLTFVRSVWRGTAAGPMSAPDFVDLEAETAVFAAMGAAAVRPKNLTGIGMPRRLASAEVTSGMFTTSARTVRPPVPGLQAMTIASRVRTRGSTRSTWARPRRHRIQVPYSCFSTSTPQLRYLSRSQS